MIRDLLLLMQFIQMALLMKVTFIFRYLCEYIVDMIINEYLSLQSAQVIMAFVKPSSL